MAVTTEDVLRVADLARLRLEPEEVAALTRELNGILEHVDALAAAGPAPDPDPAAGETPDGEAAGAPLRVDTPGADPLAVEPRAMAPAWADGHFTVPRLASHAPDAWDGDGREERDRSERALPGEGGGTGP